MPRITRRLGLALRSGKCMFAEIPMENSKAFLVMMLSISIYGFSMELRLGLVQVWVIGVCRSHLGVFRAGHWRLQSRAG